MPELWMPGAQRLDIGDHAPCDTQYPPRAIAHITWDKNATAAKPADLVPYENLRSYFSGGGRAVAPHILWDPFTGRVCQFVPASSRSKSLVDLAGGTRTNRAGAVVIQVEALFFPYCRVGDRVYPRLVDTPCKGWEELHAWVRSWGVADAWPNGRPEDCTRNERTWETKSGWYPHAAVPENDHQDPLSWPAFPAAATAPAPAKQKYEPYPGEAFFMSGSQPAYGKSSPIFTAMGHRLVAKGFGRYYSVGPGPKLGPADVKAYEAFQRSLGYTGSAATWPPGPTSWSKLQVPNV